MGSIAFGQNAPVTKITNLSQVTTTVNVDINSEMLKLSIADYSSPTVKILVPELAAVTILDHRNTNEGAPCLATYDTYVPSDVIQNNPAIEPTLFKIALNRKTISDPIAKTCHVELEEIVTADIRGFSFYHQRSHNIGERHLEDCQ